LGGGGGVGGGGAPPPPPTPPNLCFPYVKANQEDIDGESGVIGNADDPAAVNSVHTGRNRNPIFDQVAFIR
jgi:hypothetical protein